MQSTVREEVEEAGLMNTISSFFGRGQQDRTSILTHGHDSKIDPIFVLMIESLAQIVRQNPCSFEYKSSYLAWIAAQLHKNRFWEFVQSNRQDKSMVALPCIFSPEFRQKHKNKIFESRSTD